MRHFIKANAIGHDFHRSGPMSYERKPNVSLGLGLLSLKGTRVSIPSDFLI
jgi:hypothetical protein